MIIYYLLCNMYVLVLGIIADIVHGYRKQSTSLNRMYYFIFFISRRNGITLTSGRGYFCDKQQAMYIVFALSH